MRPIILSMILTLSVIAAASANPYRDCDAGVVSGCTYIIESNAEARYKAVAYYNRGLNSYRAGEIDKAINDFTLAIKMKPDDADAYDNRGISYIVKKEYDRALADFDRAIRIKPRSDASFYNRGVAYQLKGDYSQAIADYNRALAINPRVEKAAVRRREAQAALDAQVVQNRGRMSAGQSTASEKNQPFNSRKAAEGSATSGSLPKTTNVPSISERQGRASVAQCNKGNVLECKKIIQSAASPADKATAYFTMGQLASNFFEMINNFNHAIQLRPDYTEAYLHRGYIYSFSLVQFDKAISDFDSAIKLNPRSANAYLYRGDTYLKKNEWSLKRATDAQTKANTRQAIADFSKALAIDPKLTKAADKLREAQKELEAQNALDALIGQNAAANRGDNSASVTRSGAVEIVPNIESGSGYSGAALSSDGTYIVSAKKSSSTLKLWDTASGRLIRSFNAPAEIQKVGFTSNGQKAFAVTDGRTTYGKAMVSVWNLANAAAILSFEVEFSSVGDKIAISPNGKYLALAIAKDHPGKDYPDIAVFEIETGRLAYTFKNKFDGKNPDILGFHTLSFSNDGAKLLFSANIRPANKPVTIAELRAIFPTHEDTHAILVLNFVTGKLERTIETGTSAAVWIAGSPDGTRVLTSGCDIPYSIISRSGPGRHDPCWAAKGPYVLELWDLASGRVIQKIATGEFYFNYFAFSPNEKYIIAAYTGSGVIDSSTQGPLPTPQLFEIATGQSYVPFGEAAPRSPYPATALAFSKDGESVLIAKENLELWNAETGKLNRRFEGEASPTANMFLLPGGRELLTVAFDGSSSKLWDLTNGRVLRAFPNIKGLIDSAALSADGAYLVTSVRQSNTISLWDTRTGLLVRSFEGEAGVLRHVAISDDGSRIFSGPLTKPIQVFDLKRGTMLGTLGDIKAGDRFILSPDRKIILSGGTGVLYNAADGKQLVQLANDGFRGFGASFAFSSDGKLIVSGTYEGRLQLFDATSGKVLRTFGDQKASFINPSPEARNNSRRDSVEEASAGKRLSAVAISPDGKSILSGGIDGIKMWDVATGRLIRIFIGHSDYIKSLVFSPDGTRFYSLSGDGTILLWRGDYRDNAPASSGSPFVVKEHEIALLMPFSDGGWLAMTREGFFSASRRDPSALTLVKGLELATVGQVYQSLLNPDLLSEALAGDPDEEVKRAAEVINLDKVLASGPPPVVEIAALSSRTHTNSELVAFTARIKDRGKGIGRIEWRVNGVTVGVCQAPACLGPNNEVSQQLALDPGENQIEIVAYEGRNLLASLPAQTTIVYDGPADATKPKLFVLAIGIDKYVDNGSKAGNFGYFPPLGLAVADATAFGEEIKKAGTGLYSNVIVKTALDSDATPEKLDQFVDQIGAEISPRDTFVLYVAGHGYSKDGRFYMIPQDYQGGADPAALKDRAIGQDRLQAWIANRIKAKKGLILLDTCQSGAVIGGYARPRTEGAASEAAIGRLHEVTGRPVLTAAAAQEFAREGYKGHGVFTYALIEALHKGDTNNNGKIEVTELAAYVQKRVPELIVELDKNGGVIKGVAVIAIRGAEGDKQSARFGSTGGDFAVTARLP